MAYNYWDHVKVKSYEDAERLWETVKNPDKGKPLTRHGKWAKRMFKCGANFEFRDYNGKKFATLSPLNILTLHKRTFQVGAFLPVIAWNVERKRGRIRVRTLLGGTTVTGDIEYINWPNLDMKKQPLWYDGIQFDLNTGLCLNRRPDPAKREKDPEKDLAWKRALRQFRGIVLTAHRMGGFNDVMELDPMEFSRLWWNPEIKKLRDLTPQLAESFKAGVIHPEIRWALGYALRSIAHSWSYRDLQGDERIAAAFNSLVNSYRNELRERFGVYAE